MKELLIALMILMFSVCSVQARPFLVCDPQEGVDSYVITFNTGEEIETPAPLHYDLEGLAPGEHVVDARAVQGVWTSDPSVPLSFTKPTLLRPALNIE